MPDRRIVLTDLSLNDDKSIDLEAGPQVLGVDANLCPISVKNSQGNAPITDAAIWITTDEAGSNSVAGGRTDANGVVKVFPSLEIGTIIYVWASKAGFAFTNPTAIEFTTAGGIVYGAEIAALDGTIVTVDMIRKRINVPEATAFRTEDIQAAIDDATFDVVNDCIIALGTELKVRATVIYAVYYAIRTYSTRGRHVPSGHTGETGHWVADQTPQGIFDFKAPLAEAEKAYKDMKARLRPTMGCGYLGYG